MNSKAPAPQQALWVPPPGRHTVCVCGRQLRHPDSVAAGKGPVCRGQRNTTPTTPRPGPRTPGTGQLDLLTPLEDTTVGWASAGTIFNNVARSLNAAGTSEDTKRRVLGQLIDNLRDGDWDTEDESLDEFREDPVIVDLFAQRGIHLDPDLYE